MMFNGSRITLRDWENILIFPQKIHTLDKTQKKMLFSAPFTPDIAAHLLCLVEIGKLGTAENSSRTLRHSIGG